jgi:peptide/nickel transport system substrate-binding protein
VLALLAGEVDLVMDLPREQVRVIDARPNLTVVRAPVGQAMTLDVNAHGKAPHDLLSDRTLRRALALALDRRQLVRVVLAGEASEVQGMTVPAVLGPYAARVQGFAYDTARAQALLDSAGWRRGADGVRRKGGRALALTLLANPELEPAVPEFVQAELRAIGIPLRWVRLPDLASYAARNNAGEFDLNLSVPNQNDGDPLFLPALIFHSKSQRPFARWHSVGERFDRLVDEGLRAVDPEEARRLAAEAMHEAVDVEAIAIPVAGRFRLYAMKREVRGFAPHPAQTHQSWSTVSVGGAAPVASAR